MIETQILQHEVSLTEYVPACVEVEKFVKFCEECPSYEKNWACPPFNFSPQEIWQKHDSLLLYGKKIFLGAELTGKQYESDELIALVKELLLPWRYLQGSVRAVRIVSARRDKLVYVRSTCGTLLNRWAATSEKHSNYILERASFGLPQADCRRSSC